MGMRLGQQDGYPVGVDNSHPHFHGGDEEIDCPACDERIPAEVGDCPLCGATIDGDTISDQLDARNEPDEDWRSER
jgi:hypothetical protein